MKIIPVKKILKNINSLNKNPKKNIDTIKRYRELLVEQKKLIDSLRLPLLELFQIRLGGMLPEGVVVERPAARVAADDAFEIFLMKKRITKNIMMK